MNESARRSPTSKLQDAFLLFDPGGVNLLMALRGTLGVVVSFFCVSYLATIYNESSTISFLGVMLAMNASMFVREPAKRRHQVIMLGVCVPACLTLAASVLLAGYPSLRMLGLLVVIFFAVFLRRRGGQWLAVGVISFFSYFLPLFLPVPITSLPFALVSNVIAIFVSYLIHFHILPDRPEATLHRYLDTFEIHKLRLIALLDDAVENPTADRDKIDLAFTDLSDLSLLIEEFLKNTGARSFKSRAENLQMRVFEQELALRQLAQEVEERSVEHFVGGEAENSGRAFFRDKLKVLSGNVNVSAGTIELIIDELQDGRLSKRKSITKERAKGLHLNTRQAIQATLATALASGAGYLISSQRWYWAALASFVVFIGSSRGETLTRAVYRVLGTAVGLLIGFGLIRMMSGRPGLEWSLIVACVFLGIFVSRLTFGFWTAGLFTIMIAALFDVLGQLTNTLFVLRMEETVIGAIIGAVVGSFVLPNSTTASVEQSLLRLLQTIAEVLDDLPLAPGVSKRKFVGRLREIDYDMQSLRAAASPVVVKMTVMKRGTTPDILHAASLLTHYVLHFAILPIGDECRETVGIRSRAVAARIFNGAVAARVSHQALPAPLTSRLDSPHYALDRIEQIVAPLLRRLGREL